MSCLPLVPGDVLRVERRYVLDGHLKRVTDKGRFAGIQTVGSAEHIVLEDDRKGVRMLPLHAISEIRLVTAAPRREAVPETAAWDPGVA